MQLEETDSLDFDPLDPAKVWPEDAFPINGSRDNDVKS